MAVPTISWVKNMLGGPTELDYIEVGEDVKNGDILVAGDSTQEIAMLMDDNAEFAIGVATHDTDSGEICAYIPATPWNVFMFEVEAAYDDSRDRFTTCDVSTFTSGGMLITPNTDSTNMIHMLGKVGGCQNKTAAGCDVAGEGYILGVFKQANYIVALG